MHIDAFSHIIAYTFINHRSVKVNPLLRMLELKGGQVILGAN